MKLINTLIHLGYTRHHVHFLVSFNSILNRAYLVFAFGTFNNIHLFHINIAYNLFYILSIPLSLLLCKWERERQREELSLSIACKCAFALTHLIIILQVQIVHNQTHWNVNSRENCTHIMTTTTFNWTLNLSHPVYNTLYRKYITKYPAMPECSTFFLYKQ